MWLLTSCGNCSRTRIGKPNWNCSVLKQTTRTLPAWDPCYLDGVMRSMSSTYSGCMATSSSTPTLIAWLLDPGGSHGFGDRFLRGFLAQVGARGVIRAADLPRTTVRREHYLEQEGESGRLDILIRNESAEFLCAIENKVWASESGDQLAWYRKVPGVPLSQPPGSPGIPHPQGRGP